MTAMLTLLILALALAMDAFAAALCRGATTRAGVGGALAVGAAFGTAQGVMPLIGWGLGVAFAEVIRSVDHWVAFLLLVGIGGKMLHETLQGDDDDGDDGDDDYAPAPVMGGWALLGAAIATSIDAAAAGVTLPLIETPILIACLVIAGVTFLLSTAGVLMGAAVGALAGRWATIAGGVALIGIGIKILIEHLFYGG